MVANMYVHFHSMASLLAESTSKLVQLLALVATCVVSIEKKWSYNHR